MSNNKCGLKIFIGTSGVCKSLTKNTLFLGMLCVTLTACGGGGGGGGTTTPISNNTTPTASDTVAPEVTLVGESVITLQQGEAYEELGATASDNVDGTISVNAPTGTVNSNFPGIYVLTYSVVDAAGNASNLTRSVEVVGPRPFITTWKTDNEGATDDDQIVITTNRSFNNYNYNVDWGDGSTSENRTGNSIHTYAAPGIYTVAITGRFPQTYFALEADGINFEGYDNNKLLSVEQWGDVNWQSMKQAFYYCSNLVNNAIDIPNLQAVTDMSFAFEEADLFNQNVGDWDVSSVTNMYSMFYGADSFNQDVGAWDVSSVTNLGWMFGGARLFNQDVSTWNVSSVELMNGLFSCSETGGFPALQCANAFNQDISNWDVSSVTTMQDMFYGASSFNQDIGAWNVSAVTDMKWMFQEAIAFNQDIGDWGVSSVTDMGFMFTNAAAFNQDLSDWNVSLVTDMESMFDGVTLSVANYDAWLMSLRNQTLNHGVSFSGGNSRYSETADFSREFLVDRWGWIITDGGLAP